MKIEKVNDNQIRCTLTKADLADRQLKLSELAYGTEKAKDLFRDMMQQASYEFGFEAEDIPLMIEAIPLNSECIVLIITKVEDPDELDTRFSKFAPSIHEDGSVLDDVLDSLGDGADDVLDLFKKIQNSKAGISPEPPAAKPEEAPATPESQKRSLKETLKEKLSETTVASEQTRIYGFASLHEIIASSRVLSGFYEGDNSLYKQKDGTYLLVLARSSHSSADFNRICNILSEYGNAVKSVPASEAYLEEHFDAIIKKNALQSLSCI